MYPTHCVVCLFWRKIFLPSFQFFSLQTVEFFVELSFFCSSTFGNETCGFSFSYCRAGTVSEARFPALSILPLLLLPGNSLNYVVGISASLHEGGPSRCCYEGVMWLEAVGANRNWNRGRKNLWTGDHSRISFFLMKSEFRLTLEAFRN